MSSAGALPLRFLAGAESSAEAEEEIRGAGASPESPGGRSRRVRARRAAPLEARLLDRVRRALRPRPRPGRRPGGVRQGAPRAPELRPRPRLRLMALPHRAQRRHRPQAQARSRPLGPDGQESTRWSTPASRSSRTGSRRRSSRASSLVLRELPDKYRIPLKLKDIDGLSVDEVARLLDVSYSTVRWRLHKARRLFRDKWTRMERLEERTAKEALRREGANE